MQEFGVRCNCIMLLCNQGSNINIEVLLQRNLTETYKFANEKYKWYTDFFHLCFVWAYIEKQWMFELLKLWIEIAFILCVYYRVEKRNHSGNVDDDQSTVTNAFCALQNKRNNSHWSVGFVVGLLWNKMIYIAICCSGFGTKNQFTFSPTHTNDLQEGGMRWWATTSPIAATTQIISIHTVAGDGNKIQYFLTNWNCFINLSGYDWVGCYVFRYSWRWFFFRMIVRTLEQFWKWKNDYCGAFRNGGNDDIETGWQLVLCILVSIRASR